ncbi:MAG: hypothetical protein ABH883_09210, partial [Candidatus Omnitrophota bacterium]
VFFSAVSFCGALELVGKEGVLYSGENTDWKAFLEGELRLAYDSTARILTLDYNDKSDLQNYMGYQWYTGLGVSYLEKYEGYIKIASYGPAEYDAPVVPRGQVHTLWGDVGEYWGKKLLPRLEEWWVDAPLDPVPARVKTGLFCYTVGSGLALGGDYEKYGVNLYHENDNFEWTAHFDVPDIDHKWYLGPKLIAEKEAFNIRYDTKAYFFATDMVIKFGDNMIQPYAGFLADMTPWARRSSVYDVRVDKDYLGTYGGYLNLNFGEFSLFAESAANFGKAVSADPGYCDMKHTGYMFFTGASYSFRDDRIVPRARFFYISGNKFTGGDITDGQIVKSANREFSVYSPTDSNLADTHYPAFDMGPYVFSGMGDNLNQGIPRPNTFGDPYQMSNLIAPAAGIDIRLTDKFSVSLDYWYLHTEQLPVGADYDPVKDEYHPYTLPGDLGSEFDIYAEYSVNDNIRYSFLAGIFFPGDYYRKRRGDEDAAGIAASPRFDGGASNAWVIEAAVTYVF